MEDFATCLARAGAGDLRQDRIAHGVERLRDQRRADDLGGITGAERDQAPAPAAEVAARDAAPLVERVTVAEHYMVVEYVEACLPERRARSRERHGAT